MKIHKNIGVTKESFDIATKNISPYYLFDHIVNAMTGRNQSFSIERSTHISEKRSRGEFEFIPKHPESVIESMYIMRELFFKKNDNYLNGVPLTQYNFYDLGSGIGNILALANYYLHIPPNRLFGVENSFNKNAPYFVAPKIEKDIFDLTRDDIEDHSIIYLYNPLCDRKKMQLALDHILSILKPFCPVMFLSAMHEVSFSKSPNFEDYDGQFFTNTDEFLMLTK